MAPASNILALYLRGALSVLPQRSLKSVVGSSKWKVIAPEDCEAESWFGSTGAVR